MGLARDSIRRQTAVQPHLDADRHRPADGRGSALVVPHRGPRISPRQAKRPSKLGGMERAPEAPQIAQRLAGGVQFRSGHAGPLANVAGHFAGVLGGRAAAGFMIPLSHGDRGRLGPGIAPGLGFMLCRDSGVLVGGAIGGRSAVHPVLAGPLGHRFVLRWVGRRPVCEDQSTGNPRNVNHKIQATCGKNHRFVRQITVSSQQLIDRGRAE